MPDKATIEAARPKCPRACGRRMRFNRTNCRWTCPEHGVEPRIVTGTPEAAAKLSEVSP